MIVLSLEIRIARFRHISVRGLANATVVLYFGINHHFVADSHLVNARKWLISCLIIGLECGSIRVSVSDVKRNEIHSTRPLVNR